MSHPRLHMAAVAAAILIIPALTGCATKKHVRTQVEPLERRVDGLEKQNKQQSDSIAEVERGVSRADERARGADARAAEASREAANAQKTALAEGEAAKRAAADASTAAGGARSLAELGIGKADETGRRMELLDNFKLIASETVLFGSASSQLTEEANAALDTMAGKLAGRKRYVIEIQGFTDKTGAAAANLELSRLRAGAVAQYLTTKHQVPLHRIHMIGQGSEAPASDNKTRDGRRQNRRVEVKLFEADLGAASAKR